MNKIFGIILLTPLSSFALLNPPEFVSLVPPGAYTVLEKENQLTQLCSQNDPLKVEKCKEENLKPQSWSVSVYAEPKKDSKTLGKLILTATPGKGMTAEFQDNANKTWTVLSDSKQTDWGYSSFFEFSIRDKKGDWLQLPKKPFQNPVWINLKTTWPNEEIPREPSSMEPGTVYTVEGLGDIVITTFKGYTFTYRMENKNDMLCGDEPAVVPKSEIKEFTKPVDLLYNSDGHLIAWIKYSRGC